MWGVHRTTVWRWLKHYHARGVEGSQNHWAPGQPRRILQPLVPTLRATLGVKGYRPTVETWDNQEQGYCFAALNLVRGRLTTRLLEPPARSKAQTGQRKQQRRHMAFAAHRRDIARAYPASAYAKVVITIDTAPWHRGALMEHV